MCKPFVVFWPLTFSILVKPMFLMKQISSEKKKVSQMMPTTPSDGTQTCTTERENNLLVCCWCLTRRSAQVENDHFPLRLEALGFLFMDSMTLWHPLSLEGLWTKLLEGLMHQHSLQ